MCIVVPLIPVRVNRYFRTARIISLAVEIPTVDIIVVVLASVTPMAIIGLVRLPIPADLFSSTLSLVLLCRL